MEKNSGLGPYRVVFNEREKSRIRSVHVRSNFLIQLLGEIRLMFLGSFSSLYIGSI